MQGLATFNTQRAIWIVCGKENPGRRKYFLTNKIKITILVFLTFTLCINNCNVLLMKFMKCYRKKWTFIYVMNTFLNSYKNQKITCQAESLFQMNLKAELKISMQTKKLVSSQRLWAFEACSGALTWIRKIYWGKKSAISLNNKKINVST